ncbi:MAG: hypothetical protein K1060chlam2_00549 [Chlamydiae bacterium]|nr:hypothetical protein [Chlamydiota bacterium]
MEEITDWDDTHYKGGDGIIVATNEKLEWLLKWWWGHYIKHNTFPVTFIDFGMSKSARIWCENRAPVITLSPPPLKPQEAIPHETQEIWESIYGPTLWDARKGWGRKPFAFLKTPYDRTIWLDIDCQVLKPLHSLFDASASGIAMVLEPERTVKKSRKLNLLLPGEVSYNSGVVSFLRTCPLIPEWAKRTLSDNHLFYGDQDILSRIIHEQKPSMTTLPDIYNRQVRYGYTPETFILHFVGGRGKKDLFRLL